MPTSADGTINGDLSSRSVDSDGAGAAEMRIPLADGRVLACLALGDPHGAPVLYFHGYPGSRLEAGLAKATAKRLGLRLLALDRPGFGGSSFLPGRTLGSWATDVTELADRLALERFAVLGVSGGGPYALACGARVPARVSGAAVVGGLAPLVAKSISSNMVPFNRLFLGLAAHSGRSARAFVEVVARWIRRRPQSYIKWVASGVPAPDQAALADPAFRDLLVASAAEALGQGGRGAAWELTLIAQPWDFDLREVAVPVDIWQGLADRIVPPAMARYLAASLPYGKPHYLPGEGHFSVIAHHIDRVLAELSQPPSTSSSSNCR